MEPKISEQNLNKSSKVQDSILFIRLLTELKQLFTNTIFVLEVLVPSGAHHNYEPLKRINDCGIYLIAIIDHHIRECPICLTNEDIEVFRYNLGYNILTGDFAI